MLFPCALRMDTALIGYLDKAPSSHQTTVVLFTNEKRCVLDLASRVGGFDRGNRVHSELGKEIRFPDRLSLRWHLIATHTDKTLQRTYIPMIFEEMDVLAIFSIASSPKVSTLRDMFLAMNLQASFFASKYPESRHRLRVSPHPHDWIYHCSFT